MRVKHGRHVLTALLAAATLTATATHAAAPRTYDLDAGEYDALVYYPSLGGQDMTPGSHCPPSTPPWTFGLLGQMPEALFADLNSDGIDDLIMADDRWLPELRAGEVFALFGPLATGDELRVDDGVALSVRAGYEFEGLAMTLQSPRAHTLAVGDITGDGVTDLAIAAPNGLGPSGLQQNTGQIYIIAGPFSHGRHIDLSQGQFDIIVYGPHPSYAVQSPMGNVAIADVSGDGRDDLVMFGNGTELRVLFGPLPIGTRVAFDVQPADVQISEFMGAGLGGTLALGDVNGDGHTDIVTGSVYRSSTRVNAFFGPFAAGTSLDPGWQYADVTIDGTSNQLADLHVTDLTGDGSDDIVLTQYGSGPTGQREHAGEAHVFFGPFSTGDSRHTLAGDPDWSVYGAESGDSLVNPGSGDHNGDGVRDLVLGAGGSDPAARPDADRAYLFEGPLVAGTVVDLAADDADVEILGRDGRDGNYGVGGDALGQTVALADLSGNGRDDLVLISSQSIGPMTAANAWTPEVYAIFGDAPRLNQPPVAEAGGPYTMRCNGGAGGIWLDGLGSIDGDPGDTLEYLWTTTCPGSITDPTSARTQIRVDCHRCQSFTCEVTLGVMDPFGASDTDSADLRVTNPICRALPRGGLTPLGLPPEAAVENPTDGGSPQFERGGSSQ